MAETTAARWQERRRGALRRDDRWLRRVRHISLASSRPNSRVSIVGEEGRFERLPRPELEEFFDVGKHGMYGEGHAPLRFIRFAISFETRRNRRI